MAWRSEIYSYDGPGTIPHLGMMVGRDDGASFLHGHGHWSPETGEAAMGHILAQQTMSSVPTIAYGIGLGIAYFDCRPTLRQILIYSSPQATLSPSAMPPLPWCGWPLTKN